MAVRSLSKIESTDCFEYCSEFFSKISVGADKDVSKNHFFKKKNGGTHHASALGLV
jgi:hypothetical protein